MGARALFCDLDCVYSDIVQTSTTEVQSMPLAINGRTYYRSSEVCREIGICRATLFRWLNGNIIAEPQRDRTGWRLFTEDDVEALGKKYA